MNANEPAALQSLHALAGRWTGRERLAHMPWQTAGEATSLCEARVDGRSLVTDYAKRVLGAPPLVGRGVYGYDAERGAMTMRWFDSLGTRVEAFGRIEGECVVFERPGARYIYRLAPDRWEYTFELERDGTWVRAAEGVFERQPPTGS